VKSCTFVLKSLPSKMESVEDASTIDELPDFLLIDILSRLSAPELVRLGIGCKALFRVSQLDELWRPLTINRFGGRGENSVQKDGREFSWMLCYTTELSTRCRDCFRRTEYVFSPLNRRLCPECEQTSLRYRLVTAEQATEELDVRVSATLLKSTSSIVFGGFTFYLQSELLERSRSSHSRLATHERGKSGDDESKQDSQEEEEDDEAGDEEDEERRHQRGTGSASRKAALKEQRKLNRKTTKLLQRAKRHGDEVPHTLPSGFAKKSYQQRPPIKKNKSKSECLNLPRQLSPWESQREQLEAKFGQFGISGLVLSTTS